MRRFLSNLVRDFRTAKTARPARRAPRRASLQVEGLEDRMVPASASLVGSTLQVTADPGLFGVPFHGHVFPSFIQQIKFQGNAQQPGMLDVSEGGTSLGQFPIASIQKVDVNLAYLDAVSVDDSIDYPFASGTTISVSGSSGNSLTLTGSRTISGSETYTPGGEERAQLTLAGTTIDFDASIGSVTDSVKTGTLVVNGSNVGNPSLSGQNGVTQTLSGLTSDGNAGNSLT